MQEDSPLDRRIRDFVSGTEKRDQLCYEQPHNLMTNWDNVMRSIDLECELLSPDVKSFIESFPLFSCIDNGRFPISKENEQRIRF